MKLLPYENQCLDDLNKSIIKDYVFNLMHGYKKMLIKHY